jgi:hypothetical protein
MNNLTRAERLNYEYAGTDNRIVGLLDLHKYGFLDTNIFNLIGDKNQYLLKKEFGSLYVYVAIEQAYYTLKKTKLLKDDVLQIRNYIDKVDQLKYKNPYTLIVGFIARDLTTTSMNRAFEISNKLSDENHVNKHDIVSYAVMWNRVIQ